MAKGSYSKDHLIENDSSGPDIDLGRDVGAPTHIKTFGRKVPVGSSTLRGQFDSAILIGIIVGNDLGQAEVCDFDFSFLIKNDISGLQIIVNDALFLFVEVLESRKHLTDDATRFSLG